MKKDYTKLDKYEEACYTVPMTILTSFEDLYWSLYRFWNNKIKTFPKEIYWHWQRAFRGWADCDVWNMNSYLARIIVPMLEHMKKNHCGVPSEFLKEKDLKIEEASKEWESTLDLMIEGFKTYEELQESCFERLSPDDLEKRILKLEEKHLKGMMFFVKYFNNLWN